MTWFVVAIALYGLAIAATWWLTANVVVFEMVAGDERAGVSVLWPFTWLAALCATLLIGTAMVHERIARRSEG